MENDSVKNNYELAFHINSNLEEAKVAQIREDIGKLVIDNGGTITFIKEPEKTRLSYPIKHERQSYFGYMQFSLMGAETLPAIDEHMRLNNDIIRYLILKLESDEQKAKASAKAAAQKDRQEKRAKRAQAEQKASPEMEKQIEDILGNL